MSGPRVHTTDRGRAPASAPAAAAWRFDQLQVGQSASFERLITDEDIQAFARLTGDFSPLHTDRQFARRSRFRDPVAHGMLVSSTVSTLVGMYLPGRYATLVSQRLRYLSPVRAGDRLTIQGTVAAKQEAVGLMELNVAITNQRGETVVTGALEALVTPPPRRALHMADLASEPRSLDFTGQVVLVTGASRGVGEAAAKLFAHHGARVVLNYFQGRDDAEAAVADIVQHEGQAIAVQADVRDAAQVRQMVTQAVERFGTIDILVNNAMNQALPHPFERVTWDDLQGDLDVAVKGAFYCLQAVLPAMLKRRHGKVISLTTVYTNGTPPAGFSRYLTAKSALLGLSRALAVEYAPHHIMFNVISPGFTDTDLTSHVPQAIKQRMADEHPARKLGDPLDIAKAIVLMASSYTDYVVGGQLLVCGGSTII